MSSYLLLPAAQADAYDIIGEIISLLKGLISYLGVPGIPWPGIDGYNDALVVQKAWLTGFNTNKWNFFVSWDEQMTKRLEGNYGVL